MNSCVSCQEGPGTPTPDAPTPRHPEASERLWQSAQTMMEWAAIVVAEPRNVAHVFAKDVGVPEAFGSST